METNNYFPQFKELQKNEVDGSVIYKKIAKRTKDEKNRKTLIDIADDELRHSKIFEKYTKESVRPRRIRILFYVLASYIFGYTFVIKILEKDEDKGIELYKSAIVKIPELNQILKEEEIHEQELIEMLDEDRLKYIGDMVLGMNDALVELTGALAGYTLAMQNTNMIAMAGMITGIAATLSMASSGYLASREAGQENPGKSAMYTGIAYFITVVLLIIPYLILSKDNYIHALVITLIVAIGILALFNFYVSVAKDRPFRRNFLTMAGISMGVAAISFIVGLVVKNVLGIDL